MNDNLPKKYNDNIFSRFFGFLKNLFYGRKNEPEEVTPINQIEEEKEVKPIEKEDSTNDFIERIKIDANYKNPENEKHIFMDNLKENPDLLENFSNDRLEKILQYYQDENAKKKEILKKLTA